jgi:hypothetical protein
VATTSADWFTQSVKESATSARAGAARRIVDEKVSPCDEHSSIVGSVRAQLGETAPAGTATTA